MKLCNFSCMSSHTCRTLQSLNQRISSDALSSYTKDHVITQHVENTVCTFADSINIA